MAFLISAYNPVNGDLFVYDRTNSDILRFKENGEVDVYINYSIIDPNEALSWMQVSPDGKILFFSAEYFGTDVITLDIETKEILQTYQYQPKRSMIGASFIVSKDSTLYKMGGYGYWDFRNILAEWHPDRPEWNATNVEGVLPSRGDPAFLFYIEELDELFYVVHPMPENSSFAQIELLELYRFDLLEKRWEKTGAIETNEAIPIIMNYHRASRSQAISPQLFHLINEYFINRDNLQLYVSEFDLFKVVRGSAAYYSKRLGKRIIVAESNTSDSRELFIRVVDEEDLKLTPVPIKEPDFTLWVAIVLISVSVISGGLIFYRFRGNKSKLELNRASFVIQKDKNEDVRLFYQGEKISLSDPGMKRFWKLLYRLKMEQQSEIYLSELDQILFVNSSNAALNSRTRGKLFKVVEEMAKEPFISVEPSLTDKRYKIVRFNLDLVKVVESD